MMNSSLRYIIVGLFVVVLAACSSEQSGKKGQQEPRYEYGIPVDSFLCVSSSVHSGETLGGILNRLGASRAVINQLTLLPRDTFDARTIRADKNYHAYYQTDSVLRYFVYEASITDAYRFEVLDTLRVKRFHKDVRHEIKTSSAEISSSLWMACVDAEVNPVLAVELSEVYQWTIDFFGLQQGDKFTAYYEELFVDTVSIGIGRIYAAAFTHNGKEICAYQFDTTNCRGYFDENGKSLRKAFLKAPLNYKRVSSKFTYHRKHPIFKTVRPHTGVDYAAPAGTPVVALGDGVVIEKGYKGGGGNTLKIRHNATYTTAYLHLQKFANGINIGTRVSQGQLIGYVGSTGNSTGPHLDFRVWKNGTPVDPLKMESPSVDPVPAAYKDAYMHLVDSMNVCMGR